MDDRGLAMARARLADDRSNHLARLVAHEVRNALAGIGGALEVVRNRLSSAQGMERQACEAMQQRLQSLDGLMDGLTFKGFAADAPREPIRLRGAAETSAAVFSVQLGKERWVEVRGQEEVVVEGDPDLIRLLLHTFISAAVSGLGESAGPFLLTVVRRGAEAVVEVSAPGAAPSGEVWSRARVDLALAERLISRHGSGQLKTVANTHLRLHLPLR